jgi:hypothetical protein
LKAKSRRCVAFSWQDRSDLEMKQGTHQVRKGGQGNVNRGWLRRDRGGRGGVASGTRKVVTILHFMEI